MNCTRSSLHARKIRRSFLAAFLCCAGPTTCFGVVTIDSFSDGPLFLTTSQTVVQDSLDTQTVASGGRKVSVSALNSVPFEARVNTTSGDFAFESATFGYFTLSYAFAAGMEVDLKADGSTAFRLFFPEVTPGLWRGRYAFTVDGVSYEFSKELFAIEGSGAFDVPFSFFTTEPVFAPSAIRISGSRVEPGIRIVLESVATVPEPSMGILLAGSLCTLLKRSRTRRAS